MHSCFLKVYFTEELARHTANFIKHFQKHFFIIDANLVRIPLQWEYACFDILLLSSSGRTLPWFICSLDETIDQSDGLNDLVDKHFSYYITLVIFSTISSKIDRHFLEHLYFFKAFLKNRWTLISTLTYFSSLTTKID